MDADKDLLVKFPRTTHLLSDSDVTSRGDLLMTEKEVQAWTQSNVVVEEKVDGANIGISVTDKYEIRFQNRSHFVNSETQTQVSKLREHRMKKPQSSILSILNPQHSTLNPQSHNCKYEIVQDIGQMGRRSPRSLGSLDTRQNFVW
eukprot:TRINITY_DN4591_c0_g1_i4.p1 TRINITY_DN4591_c0_g1~~TRINITY_DN4591_c0_g1_i4.p1  ORF type:complete len:146 (+),score=27.65 TRINITY_DN4591_c0_g1_i4:201-638(+)